jgi:hypothetical protein
LIPKYFAFGCFFTETGSFRNVNYIVRFFVDKLKFDGSVDSLRQSVGWGEVGGMGFAGVKLGGGAEFFYSAEFFYK